MFFFNDTATTEIYSLTLHDALPISMAFGIFQKNIPCLARLRIYYLFVLCLWKSDLKKDRKSTRLNSSHANISYVVFCLQKRQSDRVLSPAVVDLRVLLLSVCRSSVG